MTKELSITRAADRDQLALAIERLAIKLGCSVSVDSGPPQRSRTLLIRIEAPGGACVSISLDGASSCPNAVVLSWYMAYGSNARFSEGAMRNVNPYHRAKATDVVFSPEQLLQTLTQRLQACQDGSAYLEPELAQAVAAVH